VEDSGFSQSFVHHGVSQDCCCVVHREFTVINDLRSIIAFGTISKVSFNAEYLEMKDIFDPGECAQTMWSFYQGHEHVERLL
jgi:hypothetical protein